jgi:hypothetical protein
MARAILMDMVARFCILAKLILFAAIFGGIARYSIAVEKAAAAAQLKADEAWDAQQLKLPVERRPFDIKGDRLGMSLAAFKRKYYRDLGPNKPPAPQCSDSRPDKDNPMLFYKAEMANAGIVAASTTYPHEAFESKPIKPTIAGVDADAFIYKFTDGKLYEISISFGQKGFQQVKKALTAKFGEPIDRESDFYQVLVGGHSGGDTIAWSNEVSTIVLWERTGDLTPLMLVTHKQLAAEAENKLSKVRASKGL